MELNNEYIEKNQESSEDLFFDFFLDRDPKDYRESSWAISPWLAHETENNYPNWMVLINHHPTYEDLADYNDFMVTAPSNLWKPLIFNKLNSRWIYHEPNIYLRLALRFKKRSGEYVISGRKIYTDYKSVFLDEEIARLQFLIRQSSISLLHALRVERVTAEAAREKFSNKRLYKWINETLFKREVKFQFFYDKLAATFLTIRYGKKRATKLPCQMNELFNVQAIYKRLFRQDETDLEIYNESWNRAQFLKQLIWSQGLIKDALDLLIQHELKLKTEFKAVMGFLLQEWSINLNDNLSLNLNYIVINKIYGILLGLFNCKRFYVESKRIDIAKLSADSLCTMAKWRLNEKKKSQMQWIKEKDPLSCYKILLKDSLVSIKDECEKHLFALTKNRHNNCAYSSFPAIKFFQEKYYSYYNVFNLALISTQESAEDLERYTKVRTLYYIDIIEKLAPINTKQLKFIIKPFDIPNSLKPVSLVSKETLKREQLILLFHLLSSFKKLKHREKKQNIDVWIALWLNLLALTYICISI